ncbi:MULTISPECIES: dermonecrotic toxin domain-containing protein [unclassified Pseudomonas]|uniref:dermonecrotic toxin domain-containing protein n=1 Tax=unclassified Pseudomonas TaxID=196821 RepID=UPI00215C8DB0|nr:DUF6543 domain-containing protein [Pseudomonas sp. S11P7]MCR8973732.1 hypothetical protein [Pseudomonas sp. S11P7]
MTFDVEKDYLSLPGVDCGCPATSTDEDGVQTFPHATPTLLQAAMQNFSEDEAEDTFPQGSFIRISSAAQGVSGLTPVAFAKLCRELDLGKRYQEHFQKVFGLRDSNGKVVATSTMTRDVATLKKRLFQLDLQLAGLRKHIPDTTQQVLQKLLDNDGVIPPKTLLYNKRAMIMQGVKLLDSCIWGVVVFSSRSVELYPNERCVVYMPGEPQRPLYEYSSFKAFKQYLTQQLQVTSYKDYFANSLDEDDKADFFKTFTDSKDLATVKQWPISVGLFEFMVQSHVGKLQLDARKLAVPTADIDEELRKKRLLDFLQLGVTVLSVAGLFLPVLGQLMMGVAVGQMLGEVFEGVEDWRRGDHQQALSHLLSVVENIAAMAAFAGGKKRWGHWAKNCCRRTRSFSRNSPPLPTARASHGCGSLIWRFTNMLCRRGSPSLRTPKTFIRSARRPWAASTIESSPVTMLPTVRSGACNMHGVRRPTCQKLPDTSKAAGAFPPNSLSNGAVTPTCSNASIRS